MFFFLRQCPSAIQSPPASSSRVWRYHQLWRRVLTLVLLVLVLAVLGIDPRTSYMLGMCCTTVISPAYKTSKMSKINP